MDSVGCDGKVLSWNLGYHRVVNHTGIAVWISGFKSQCFDFASYMTLIRCFIFPSLKVFICETGITFIYLAALDLSCSVQDLFLLMLCGIFSYGM